MTFATLVSGFKRRKHIPEGVHVEPLHHYSRTQRKYNFNFLQSRPDAFKKNIDQLVYFVGAVGPIMTLPQLYTVWVDQSAAGVSLITWSAYIFTAAFWITYGFIHKEKPIIFTHSCWILIHCLMVTGILMYS